MGSAKQVIALAFPVLLCGCYYPAYPSYYAYPYDYHYYGDAAYPQSPPPQPYYQNTEEQYCREYTYPVMVEKQRQEVYGTACRMPDGTWKVID